MERIINNIIKCHADMETINYLLDTIKDWDTILTQRHVKYVQAYEQYKRQIKMVAAVYNFTESDMLSIFWRIQRQLFVEYINRASNGLIKSLYVPDKFDDFLMWSLMQYRDDAKSVFEFIKKKTQDQFNIDIPATPRKTNVENILKVLSMFEKLEMPVYLNEMFIDLKNGMALTDVAKKHNRSVEYLVRSIIGSKNPRYDSERGWLTYINEEPKIEKNKILEFPKGNR